jgi:hypothetical protein
LNYAIKNGIEHVIYYGDIGEYPRLSYEAQILFKSVVFDQKYKDLYHWIILGNHDFDEHGRHSLQVLRWDIKNILSDDRRKRFRVFTKMTDMVIEDVPVRFLPFPCKETSKKHLNVGHFEAAGALRDNGRKIKDGVTTTDHLSVVGHLHTCHRVGKFYYSGTLYQTNFGEALPKSFHHIKVRPNLEHKIINVPNEPEYTLINLEIYRRSDLKKIEDNPKKLYKLFVQDGVRIEPGDLEKYKNAIKLNRFKDDKDLKIQLEAEWKFESVGTVFQPEEDLISFMKEQRIESDLQKRTLKLHDRMISKSFPNLEKA